MKENLMGIGDLFGKTWEIYKKHFWKLVIIGVVCLGLTTLALVGAISAAGMYGVFDYIKIGFERFDPNFNLDQATLGAGAIGLLYVILLVIVVTSIWEHATLIAGVKESSTNWRIEDAFRKGGSKLFSCLWASFLIGLVIFLLVLVGVGIPFLGGFILALIFSTGAPVLGALIVGWVIGVILVINYSTRVIFALYAVVCENKRGRESLSRSKELVKGYWWSVFGRTFLLGFIFTGVSVIGNKTLGPIATILFGIFLSPFWASYCYLIYEDLKKIKAS